MKMNKKFLARHHLDAFSEETFAKLLDRKGEMAFFPFKDIGIDIASIDKKNYEFKSYQLKARTINKRNGEYWFKIRKSLDKVKKFPNFYWVFCALKEGTYDFDFFVVQKMKLKTILRKKRKRENFSKLSQKIMEADIL